jgi:hypothetical protein
MPTVRKETILDSHSEFAIYLRTLQKIDRTVSLILNGHLLLELEINRGLDLLGKNSKRLERSTFSNKFSRLKTLLGRDFELVIPLNNLRNTIAHSLDREARKECIQELRDAFVAQFVAAGYPAPKKIKGKRKPTDYVIIRQAFISETGRIRSSVDFFLLESSTQSPKPGA